MKRQLNLYSIALRPERPALDARRLAAISGASLGLLLVAGVVVGWHARAADARVDRLEARRAAESTRVVELAALHPPRQADARLEAGVARLEAERAAKQELLSRLGNERLGNQRGFSEHVAGLARRRVEGIWLRRIELAAGGSSLHLAGGALAPELVPRFLDALGEEDAFAGQAFRALRLAQSEGSLAWSARTDLEDAP